MVTSIARCHAWLVMPASDSSELGRRARFGLRTCAAMCMVASAWRSHSVPALRWYRVAFRGNVASMFPASMSWRRRCLVRAGVCAGVGFCHPPGLVGQASHQQVWRRARLALDVGAMVVECRWITEASVPLRHRNDSLRSLCATSPCNTAVAGVSILLDMAEGSRTSDRTNGSGKTTLLARLRRCLNKGRRQPRGGLMPREALVRTGGLLRGRATIQARCGSRWAAWATVIR